MREPCFDNLLKVLSRQVPDRPTLFEFFLNEPLYKILAAPDGPYDDKWAFGQCCQMTINAYKNAGYDYATVSGSDFIFQLEEIEAKETVSINAGNTIRNRKSFETYQWPEPDKHDYSRLDSARDWLPDGMKLIVWGPRGVLENVIAFVGYETLCLMLLDDPPLVKEIFDSVGVRLLRHYEICAGYDMVGALISNDDWGFKSQTLLSPEDLRKYVFPWHTKIVEIIHAAGKPAILHSCGNLEAVMDDIIDKMKYDAKHSFEDTIEPVEDAYERWGDRIAILGGIDLDFVCRSTTDEIRQRCIKMLARTAKKGGYALGTGNSIPEYVPDENYFALIRSATEID